MDAMVVNKNTLHLKISLFAILSMLEFNEGILQAVSCSFLPNDLTG